MHFPTTHWSLLAQASLNGETQARAALDELCQRYWGPVNAFIRSRGASDAEAQDLTQEFLLHVLQKSVFARADRLQGRFRSFLLGTLMRFLSDTNARHAALKRGGNAPHFNLEATEKAGCLEPLWPDEPAGSLFDREWALALLERALNRIRAQYAAMGRERDYSVLKNFLPAGAAPPSYETAAAQLGLSVAAFKSEVHRLRGRFRALVREEVAQTVSAPHEIEPEMEHLQQVLMNKGSEISLRGET